MDYCQSRGKGGAVREALHESDSADATNPLRDTRKGIEGSNIIKQKDSLIFDFNHVVVATDNFSLTNKLGEGGFGPVYKEGGFQRNLTSSASGSCYSRLSAARKIQASRMIEHQNHLGYAWRLWCEGRVLNLIDQALGDSFCNVEVMRCIHVGLLCVQENPADRPNMLAVILQLTSGTNLPRPKQPAFAFDNSRFSSHRSNSNSYICSVNEVTLSATEGR
ncbi:hypothetical protein SCA6_020270 [Theobroma cacao]